MAKSLQDKVSDYRTAHDYAKYGIGYYSPEQRRAERINVAKMRDAYDNAVAAQKAGLMKRAAAATIAADEEMWKMAMELNKGADNVTKSRITAASAQAGRTLDALKEFSPGPAAVKTAEEILKNTASPGWRESATDVTLHAAIKDELMGKSLSPADWNAAIGEVAFSLSFSPDDLRDAMAKVPGNEDFLARWDAHVDTAPETAEYLTLVGDYNKQLKDARGYGGSVGKLISDHAALKKALGKGDRVAVDESYEKISTIPTGEIDTRQQILDEQSPSKLKEKLYSDQRFKDQMADYGYRDPSRFYKDYYVNEGRTLRRRAPLPREGAAILDGAMGVGSPDEVRAIEQGIRDEDLAADLEKADIGRSQARTAEQADAEREWLAEYEKAEAEEPPEGLSDREYYQWQLDKLLPLQNKLHRTIDPSSDFRREWDEKLESHIGNTEIFIKESMEIEDEPFAGQGGQFMHEGQPIPIIAESDSARRRATAGALRGERPEHRPMSLKEISEGVKEAKFEDEVEDLAPAQEVAPPIPEPGMPAPEADVQAPEAETTLDQDPTPAGTTAPVEMDHSTHWHVTEPRRLERERLVRGTAMGLSPEQMALMEELKKSKGDKKEATTAWGRILQNVGE